MEGYAQKDTQKGLRGRVVFAWSSFTVLLQSRTARLKIVALGRSDLRSCSVQPE